MNKLLSGKVTLVAGKSRSMAFSIIRRFLEEEAIVLVPAQSIHELNQLTVYLNGMDTTGLVTLLTDYPDYYKACDLADLMIQRFGKIDLAVFCFDDMADTGSLADADIIDWEKMIEEQVTTYFVGGRILLNAMKEQGSGMFVGINNHSSNGESHHHALASLASGIQEKMADIFGDAAKSARVRWYHVSIKPVSADNTSQLINAGDSTGDCLLKLYIGAVNDSTDIFQSFQIPGQAFPVAYDR